MDDAAARREAIARIVDGDAFSARAERYEREAKLLGEVTLWPERRQFALAKADAILALPEEDDPWGLLVRAREYVADALDAYEHSDGRELLTEIDAALAATPAAKLEDGK